uniref:Uncharacterized protein n=1 Tax=Megaselia scalaris TaxID=36166 RepID=T1GS92_MEGSC
MLYINDFQVYDSLGPHSGGNAISAFYYKFLGLPSYLKSKILFIFVAILTLAKYDNSGIHLICGFKKGLNSTYYCRFYLTPKSICQHLIDVIGKCFSTSKEVCFYLNLKILEKHHKETQ